MNLMNIVIGVVKTKLYSTFTTTILGTIDSDYSNQSKSLYTRVKLTFTTEGFMKFVKTYLINF